MPGQKNSKKALVVIGVGASAGGVEALRAMFDNESVPTDAAFIVAMHLASNRPSQLPEILARHTQMPVMRAEHDTAIERGSVYVLPAGQLLTVHDGLLQLMPIDITERIPTVIDRLFNSLAEEYAECAIGVVLSGTGADGALGLKAIKECGGLTIAQIQQDSATMFSAMPQSAIAAGVIDLQLPVEDIADRLAAEVASFKNAALEERAVDAKQQKKVRLEICALILDRLGHDFSGYKSSTFFRRVQRRMQVLKLATMPQYVEHLRNTPSEASALLRDLLISVTSFFRDTDAFELLEKQVIPVLFKDRSARDEVRVWVPGCATGEEAYSLGVLLLEQAEKIGHDAPSIRIFATDIDERALGIARKARYPSVLMKEVSQDRRDRFFSEDRGHFTVSKRLRNICTFSPHNVLRDPPFSRIDIVSCRNLLIYLGPEFQDRILPILHYALRPEGFLFMGIAEGTSRHKTLFAPISKLHRIFRRLPSAPGRVPLPVLAPSNRRESARPFTEGHETASSNDLRKQIENRVLHLHSPPYVLVNGQGDALFYSGRTGNYMEFPAGVPSRNLLSNTRKELRLSLRQALHEAATSHVRVDMKEINLACDDGVRRTQINVDPFDDGEAPLYLVVFNDRGKVISPSGTPTASGSQSTEQLEQELRDTREQLQTTYEEFETAIEELRVANEELMSVNEELQSSNEEMETSKEELQSVNEELHTVNHQMVEHVEALDQSNADLRGLLESTGIATIFLDRQLAIRSYTHAAKSIFTLIPSDRGRTITDLNHQLNDLDLRQSLDQTLIKRESVQLAVSRKDGSQHYLMCVLPYVGASEETGGVVMTFVDVTALTDAHSRHRTMIGELNHRVRNMLAVVSAMANQTLPENDALDAFINRLHAMARTYKLLTETDWSYMSLRELFREELSVISGSNRFSLDGPSVKLDPREALALGMIVHELSTNALKYGALSNDRGAVAVAWELSESPDKSVNISWRENGGPRVTPPGRRGFGTMLVERQLAYELGGHSEISFGEEGLTVKMQLPRLDQAPNPEIS